MVKKITGNGWPGFIKDQRMGLLHLDVWVEQLLLVRAKLASKQSFFE